MIHVRLTTDPIPSLVEDPAGFLVPHRLLDEFQQTRADFLFLISRAETIRDAQAAVEAAANEPAEDEGTYH